MKRVLLILVSLLTVNFCVAQELRCNVQVNYDQVQGSKETYQEMQRSISEFMNTNRFTYMVFGNDERIECSMMIILREQSGNSDYKGEIQVSAKRPVYNSSYTTNIFAFRDTYFNFSWQEGDQMLFYENSIESNLTAILAFYAYVIIGYDMDSFALYGGSEYFQKAENIVNMAQSSSDSGWQAFKNDDNRYALISNILDEALRPIRQSFYQYHRLGLDVMAESSQKGRVPIVESVRVLQECKKRRPANTMTRLFLDIKESEILNVMTQALPDEKKDVYNILVDLNPTQSSRYSAIIN